MPDLSFANFLRTGFDRRVDSRVPVAGTNLKELVRWLSRREFLPDFQSRDELVAFVEQWLESQATRSAARALFSQFLGWQRKRGGK